MSILKRGKSIIRIGTNSKKTHPKFVRKYKNKPDHAHLHAEMNVLRFSKPGDELIVMRFLKNGKASMSKPCPACSKHIQKAQLSKVTYTDWNGNMQELNLKNLT